MALFDHDLVGSHAPEFGKGEWINSKPLTVKELRGKVALVDIWTYSCVNCVRALPYLKDWWEKYKNKGLVIVGVHSPEFEFEKDTENIKRAVKKFGIEYPVLNDATMETWRGYANNVWPRHFLINQEGVIVEDHSGEGGYSQTEQNIQKLLGLQIQNSKSLPGRQAGKFPIEEGAVCYPATPETYLGSRRASGLAQLSGNWKQEPEYAQHLDDSDGTIQIPFKSYEVNLVMHSKSGKPQDVAILLNGKPVPKELRGSDVKEKNSTTVATIDEPRMYRFIDSKDFVSGEFILKTQSPDTQAFAFTFKGCKD